MRYRIRFFALTVALVFAGCDMFTEAPAQLPGDPVEFEALSSANMIDTEVLSTNSWGPRLKEQGAFSVTDAEKFEEIWKAVAGSDDREEVPDINFSEKTVIAVHQGEQPSTAYRVEVDHVTADGDVIRVAAMDLRPQSGCAGGDAITYPIVLIAVSHTAADVEASFEVGDSCR